MLSYYRMVVVKNCSPLSISDPSTDTKLSCIPKHIIPKIAEALDINPKGSLKTVKKPSKSIKIKDSSSTITSEKIQQDSRTDIHKSKTAKISKSVSKPGSTTITTNIPKSAAQIKLSRPSLPTAGSVTVSSVAETSPPTITTVIQKNQGEPQQNPFGKRRVSPDSAPYMKYVKDIGKHLNNMRLDINKISKKQDKQIDTFANTPYLDQEKVLKANLEAKKEHLEDKHYDLFQSSSNNDFSLLGHNTDNKVEVNDVNKNFEYVNKIKFKHMQPSKKFASAYGWS